MLKEYKRRFGLILQYKVYGKKKIKVMSTWALATRKYGADIID